MVRRFPTEAEIEQRAFELYEQAGSPGGGAQVFLQRARAELEAAEAAAESDDVHPAIMARDRREQ